MPGDRGVRQRIVMRRGGRIGNSAGGDVGLRRQDVREGGVVPVDEAALGAEVGGEGEALQFYAAEALFPGLEEERDLGLAEAVDGLHRIADEEQRAAVVGLPAC